MAAVSSDGCVWTWGGNDYAQLGRQGYVLFFSSSRYLPLLFFVVNFFRNILVSFTYSA